jgi:FlaA1/EpsC-like NDP-sugar epimerase
MVQRFQRMISPSNVEHPRKSTRVKRWIFHRNAQMFLDALTAAIALIDAYALRFDFQIPASQRGAMWLWLCVVAIIRPAVFFSTRGYHATWRFFDLSDALNLALRALPVTLGLLLIRAFVPGAPVIPYSVLILEFGIFLVFASGLRIIRRVTYSGLNRTSSRPRALIIGNEATLAAAVRHLQSCGEAHVVALLSEDPALVGLHIVGIRVMGTPSALQKLLATHKIQLVILSGADLQCAHQVIQHVADYDIQVRILPSLGDLMGGRVRVSRAIGLEQVVQSREEECRTIHPAVMECFTERTVLVTGAGGSIGSEIVRQVSDLDIKRLIVLDHDENSIFELVNQLANRNLEQLVPVVGNIRDRDTVRRTFEQYRPEIVLHAAAYKHVPVMEGNCCEAVLNNIGGTRELADAAIEYSCGRMVMISTDKAVRPSSVMGATKRVAEMLVQQRAGQTMGLAHKTHFACVRFGNVLGSRGSVVPIFLRQIAAGGPVTITHEEMTRYFMTIPQAVQLVLQATTLASSGDIYMLDMGDPVKIIDFAKEIIQMSGLTPGKDIAIKVVGTRPGEKLHEQLWREDALVTSTQFPRVCQVKATPVPANFSYQLEELEKIARARSADARICSLLQQLPIDYRMPLGEHEQMAIAN